MSFKTSIVSGCGLAVALCAMTSSASSPAVEQSPHHCASAATEQAPKLLAFHFGPDSRIDIDKAVRLLAPLRNPANRTQRLDVLEVWGHIYKGQYRMRFTYAQSSKDCVLVGQEVFEYATF